MGSISVGRGKKKASVRIIQSTIDRIQGLIRNVEYIKDFNEYKKIELLREEGKIPEQTVGEKFIEIAMKHNIAFIVDPQWPLFKVLTQIDFTDLEKEVQDFLMDDLTDFFSDGPIVSVKRERKMVMLTIDATKEIQKEYLMHEIEEIIDDLRKYGRVKRSDKRNKPGNVINRFLVWDEYNKIKSFSKISQIHNVGEDTVRKAYYRAFEEVNKTAYDPEIHNKKALTKEQLARTCDTCHERATCNTVCPDVAAFVNQDVKPAFSTIDPALI